MRQSNIRQQIYSAEYLKAACPTCEDVRCPTGEECNLVKDLPICLPRIPGGCEVDKCGQGIIRTLNMFPHV